MVLCDWQIPKSEAKASQASLNSPLVAGCSQKPHRLHVYGWDMDQTKMSK